jgi:hypothetical protein
LAPFARELRGLVRRSFVFVRKEKAGATFREKKSQRAAKAASGPCDHGMRCLG